MSALSNHIVRVAVLAAVTVVAAVPAARAQDAWGELTGHFTYGGPKPAPEAEKVDPATLKMCLPGGGEILKENLVVADDGSLANVLLYVVTKGVKVHPDLAAAPAQPPVIDNLQCRFEPHVLGVVIGQKVLLKNSDPMPHNMNVQPLSDAAASINPLMSPGQTIEHKFNRAQRVPVPVKCNIHGWMIGYVLPRDNPYFAVSGKDGKFKLDKLPLNVPLEIKVWHEMKGFVDTPQWPKGSMQITLKEPVTDLGDVKLPEFPAK